MSKIGRRRREATAAGEGGRWKQRAAAANSSGGRRWRLREEGIISGRLRWLKFARRKRQMAASDVRVRRPHLMAVSDSGR